LSVAARLGEPSKVTEDFLTCQALNRRVFRKNLLLTFLLTWTDSIGKDARAQERCSRITWQYLRAYLAESPCLPTCAASGVSTRSPNDVLDVAYVLLACTRCTTCRWLFSITQRVPAPNAQRVSRTCRTPSSRRCTDL